MLFGKPTTPEGAERQRVAARLTQLDARGWRGIQEMTEEELSALASEAGSLINHTAPWNTPEEYQRAYAATMEAVRQERRRRTRAKEKERERRDDLKTAFTYQINAMTSRADKFKAAMEGLSFDDLLGTAPDASRITAREARGMSDDDLARATAEAKGRRSYATPYAQSAGDLETCIKYAQSALEELRRRAANDSEIREAANANLALLDAEQARREAARAIEAAKREEMEGDLPAIVADLRRQVAELRGE